MEKTCHNCHYHSTHYLGHPFKIDHQCSHPKLTYTTMDGVSHKVSCKVMRTYTKYCGPAALHFREKDQC